VQSIFYFLCLVVELAQVVCEDLVSQLDRIQTLHIVTNLQRHQSKGEVALSRHSVMLTEFHLEEVQHVAQVLVSLLVVNWLDLRVGVLLHLVEILIQDELVPNLNDLREERLCLLNLTFFFEKLAHVIV